MMLLRLRPALAGGLIVAFDKAFDMASRLITELTRDMIHSDTVLVAGVMMATGALIAIAITHGAHKYAQRVERELRVEFDDWRDL